MKKKIIALALVAALGASAAIGGSLAYFTDTDDATNTFTFGNVNIEQIEEERGDNGIQDFTQNKDVLPAVHSKLTKGDITVDGYNFQIRSLEGNYVDKIVHVENTGANDAYIRTIIAVPSMNGWDDSADASQNPLHWNYLDASDFNGTGWDWNGSNDAEVTAQKEYVQEVEIDGVKYDIYVATYNKAVAPDACTSPSMVGFYLDDDVNCDENGYFQMVDGKRRDLNQYLKTTEDGKATLNILVLSQACQTGGFDDAWEALDTAFGEVNATNVAEWFK